MVLFLKTEIKKEFRIKQQTKKVEKRNYSLIAYAKFIFSRIFLDLFFIFAHWDYMGES